MAIDLTAQPERPSIRCAGVDGPIDIGQCFVKAASKSQHASPKGERACLGRIDLDSAPEIGQRLLKAACTRQNPSAGREYPCYIGFEIGFELKRTVEVGQSLVDTAKMAVSLGAKGKRQPIPSIQLDGSAKVIESIIVAVQS